MSTGLADRLRTDTRTLHTELERGPFMQAMLRRQLTRAAYCHFLRNLHPVYAALEAALQEHAADPVLAPLLNPALFRTQALAQDLDCLHGSGWQQALTAMPACQVYVRRLEHLRETTPSLLTAHAYVRYLGDLSGGQLLKRIVSASLQLPDAAGTAFYAFGDAQATRDLTHSFRSGLASLAVDANQTNTIVTEALNAFGLHRDLFRQLAHAHGISNAAAPG